MGGAHSLRRAASGTCAHEAAGSGRTRPQTVRASWRAAEQVPQIKQEALFNLSPFFAA